VGVQKGIATEGMHRVVLGNHGGGRKRGCRSQVHRAIFEGKKSGVKMGKEETLLDTGGKEKQNGKEGGKWSDGDKTVGKKQHIGTSSVRLKEA